MKTVFFRHLHLLAGLLAAASPFLLLPSLHASSVILYGNTADVVVDANGTVENTTDTVARVGSSSSNGYGRDLVLVFQLPDLGSVSDPFTSADLSFTVKAFKGALPSSGVIDLTGLDARSTSTVTSADGAATGTTIQNGVLGNADSTTGLKSTDSSGSLALVDYLNTQYAAGSGAGMYIFLVLEPTQFSSAVAGYDIYTANSSTGQPFLTVTAIPEPGKVPLLLMGIFILIGKIIFSKHPKITT